MSEIKIRYNTNAKSNNELHWRVLIDGIEHLASNVQINTHCYTTKDEIEGVGTKWHISCKSDSVVWVGTKCIIN